MTAMRFAFLVATVIALSVPQAAEAETVHTTLTVVRSLSIASLRPIQLTPETLDHRLGVSAEMSVDAPAVIRITGDPGRVYRIRTPRTLLTETGETVLDDLRLWSANAGDVSFSRAGRMDLDGHDVLQITGHLKYPASGRASLPISIDYE